MAKHMPEPHQGADGRQVLLTLQPRGGLTAASGRTWSGRAAGAALEAGRKGPDAS